MKFEIDKSVFEKFEDIVEVVPIIYGFDATKFEVESEKLLSDSQAAFAEKYKEEEWPKDIRVTSYRDTFKRFGAVEGSEPSHVAMTKRILGGDKVPNINTIVNIYNSFSIKYLTPFGARTWMMYLETCD